MFAKNLEEKNVLANFIDHNLVLNFLQEMGFEVKDNTNNIVILERDDDEEFSLIAVLCDEKNKKYHAQLISTLWTVADILDVDFDYLVSNILAGLPDKTIEVKGFVDKVIDRKGYNDGYVVLREMDEENSFVKLWLPEEEYEKARTCYSCSGYFVVRMGNGSLFTLGYLNFVPDNDFVKNSFKVTCA